MDRDPRVGIQTQWWIIPKNLGFRGVWVTAKHRAQLKLPLASKVKAPQMMQKWLCGIDFLLPFQAKFKVYRKSKYQEWSYLGAIWSWGRCMYQSMAAEQLRESFLVECQPLNHQTFNQSNIWILQRRAWWNSNDCYTLPKTNVASENGWLEDYFPLGMAYIHVLC